ncbi:MAG: PhzF family phenazine biosynthesis protein [Verrucomicrobiota bacterium]|nr:PhzF family phenazine biosynthesis protein [Verrucomicrobiota bacterium]
MSIPIFQVDAFTAKPFAGNPAAVCLLKEEGEADWMQSVAAEMNLSETAFLTPQKDGFGLRWFTPKTEVDLCGHATLASAHVLWETDRLASDEVARFDTCSGGLTARQDGDWIELDFPVTRAEPVEPPPGLSDMIGSVPKFVGRSRFDLLIELADATELHELEPDFVGLSHLPVRGFIVTARSDMPEYDFLSRFFAPAAGINEDPVTGSAHCTLAPYWAEKLGKNEMMAYQASPRGGVVKMQLEGNRILLRGQAVTVLRGELA